MKIPRRLGKGLLVIALLFALCGCWSSVELNERAFARIMVLDKTATGIELSLGFPLTNRITGGSSGGPPAQPTEPPFTLVTKTGRDIGEAYRAMQADLSRRISFGQLRSILVSKSFAQEGLLPVLDFLARNTEIHINASMVVTNGPATEISQIPLTFERFPTDILAAYSKHRTSLEVTAKNVLMAVLTEGDFVLPMLTFGKMGAESERKGNKWMGPDGSALFRQGKLVAQLGPEETRAAMWINGKMGEGVMHIPSPTDGKTISFLVHDDASDIRPILRGNRIRFVISCKGSAKIIGSESSLDVTDRRLLASLEKDLNQILQDRIRQTLSHTQAQRSDVFGLGQRIRWRNPKAWKRLKGHWRDVYQEQVAIEPKADIRIKWYGGAQKPLWNQKLTDEEVRK